MISEKLLFLINAVSALSLKFENINHISPDIFVKNFPKTASARHWLSSQGKDVQPNKYNRQALKKFFDNWLGDSIKEFKIESFDEEWFSRNHSFDEFKEKFSITETPYFPITVFLPESYKRVQQFSKQFHRQYNALFSGTKILFRHALENTGALCVEIFSFYYSNGQFQFKYWFPARTGPNASQPLINEGVVLPLRNSVTLVGFHDSVDGSDLRVRLLELSFQSTYGDTVNVQRGLLLANSPSSNHPVSCKYLWVTGPSDGPDISLNNYVNNSVGFYESVESFLNSSSVPSKDHTLATGLINEAIRNDTDNVLLTTYFDPSKEADRISLAQIDWSELGKSKSEPTA